MSKKTKEKGKGLWADFKAFITRGNVLDMAVGVIMATAFSAIINGVINGILMPLINSITGGGVSGLITPLSWTLKEVDADTAGAFLWQDKYYTGQYIDWGLVINAVINFLCIALVLFIVVKAAATVARKKAELDAKVLEAYYEKHPEERPVPEEEKAPEPTEKEILAEIRDLLKSKEGK